MKNNITLLVFAIALLLGPILFPSAASNFALVAGAKAQSPNVLVIVADDLGVDPLAAYLGARRTASTPTIDSLIGEGVLFESTFAPPMCTPSRAAMLTGQYGIKTGVLGVPGTLDTIYHTLFREVERLQPGVYANAVIGKWHLNQQRDPNDPARHGVQHFNGIVSGGVRDYFNWEKSINGTISSESDYTTSVFTNEAIDWIAQQNQPWLLWLAHVAPHAPYHVPPTGLFTTQNTNSDLGKYIAMIESLDAEMARLFSTLTTSQKENTVILFVGDNGTPNAVLQEYPNGHGKATLYQGGVRVPFVISGAGVTRKGEREGALVHVADIFSTVLGLTGSTQSSGMLNSLNLSPYLSGGQRENRIFNYSEFANATSSEWTIRSNQYKLITFDDATQEFYDLRVDSLETNDLLAGGLSPSLQTIKADLEAEAAQQQDDYSCRDLIQNGDEQGIDCGGVFCSPCTLSTTSAIDIKVQFSPNPTTDLLYIQSTEGVIKYVELFDIHGRLLRRVTGVNSQKVRLSLADTIPQTLYVRMRIGDQLVVRQVVKQ